MFATRYHWSNEGLLEHLLHMRDMANPGNIDDVSLIRYIIQGIDDSPQNKVILFGCTNLTQFKQKLLIYDQLSQSNHGTKPRKQNFTLSTARTPRNQTKINCFNCWSISHVAVNCTNKHRGSKCFRCSSFGHKSFNCGERTTERKPVNEGTPSKNSSNRATSAAH